MCVVRALLCAFVLIVAGDATAQMQPGQNWPARPIKLIVATGPGLATDIMARLLSEGVSRTLGQQMFVENMPGASGIVGAGAAARAPNDGYTFFFANASGLTSNMFLIKSLPYDPVRDYTPVAMVCDSGPFVVAVHPDLPVKTLAELIAYAKAQPGKLSYAVDASSGFGVVAGKLMNKRAAMEMVEVPYRATAQMLQDAVMGTVQLMISSVAASDAFVKAGKLRRIAISSNRRFPGMEDLPTIGETLPGFVVDGWLPSWPQPVLRHPSLRASIRRSRISLRTPACASASWGSDLHRAGRAARKRRLSSSGRTRSAGAAWSRNSTSSRNDGESWSAFGDQTEQLWSSTAIDDVGF
jgi:tripartite-type tricarboxylate transporter receptor subunit TctC